MADASKFRSLGAAVERIAKDYDQDEGPFGRAKGVTSDATAQMDNSRERALFLTLTASLNRLRDATRMYEKFARLRGEEPWIFDPGSVIKKHDYEDLQSLFDREGVRFWRRDSQGWYEICRTLDREYAGDPTNLFAEHGYDMMKISQAVRSETGNTRFFSWAFPHLRGNSIRPFWLRQIHNQVVPLQIQGFDELPVNTHIVEITGRLQGQNYSTDDPDGASIRRFWRRACQPVGVEPIEVDGALWYIDRHWDDWGEGYLRRRLNDAGLDLDDFGFR